MPRKTPQIRADSLAAPPQQARSRRSLERIMAAAETVLLRGVEGFTIANVAVEGGLTVGGIYARFRSKDELLQALKDRVIGTLEERIRTDFEAVRFTSLDACLHAFVQILLRHVADDGLLQRRLLAAGDANHALSDRGSEGRGRICETYCAVLARVPGYGAPAMRPYIALSFELIVAPWLARLRDEGFQSDLSWPSYVEQLRVAAGAYLREMARPA